MKYNLLFNLLCLLASAILFPNACTHAPEQKTFPQEYRITGVHYPIFWGSIRDLELKNGFLITLSLSNSSVQVYSAADFSYIHIFEGREETGSSKMNQFVKSSTPYLYVMNVDNKNAIRKYEIDLLGQPVLLQTGFTGVSNAMNRPYVVHDSLILYDEFIPEASLKIRNLHTNSEERALPYGATSLEDRFIDKNMGGLYANDSCIAFVYKYQDRIDFYDWQFNLKQSINHQKSDPVIYPYETKTHKLPPQNVLYYGNSYMGQNYFYTLYRGVSNKVFRSDSLLTDKNFNTYVYGLKRDVLEVYDLDGSPVGRFRFDDVSPSVFVVDEEQNRLIGHRSYYDSLLVYQLQGLPKNGKKYPESVTQHHHSSLPAIPEPEKPKAYLSNVAFNGQPDIAPIYFVYMGMNGIHFPVAEIGKTSY
jgi:hypothetical protein